MFQNVHTIITWFISVDDLQKRLEVVAVVIVRMPPRQRYNNENAHQGKRYTAPQNRTVIVGAELDCLISIRDLDRLVLVGDLCVKRNFRIAGPVVAIHFVHFIPCPRGFLSVAISSQGRLHFS
jgi:hypothetical protein